MFPAAVTTELTFQSTPSVGRATRSALRAQVCPRHFNPRPPWGGRPLRFREEIRPQRFQSTPSVGRATILFTVNSVRLTFQSTPSVGRATTKGGFIAIHLNFNPRPPWGGRRRFSCNGNGLSVISIHALRGEGDAFLPLAPSSMYGISIHALRGEGDRRLNFSDCYV